jgi:beta-glucosidase
VTFGSFEISLATKPQNITTFSHRNFPPKFIFGAASSAYQYEGAASTDGRGASIWDVFSHQVPSKIDDGTNGDVVDDFYHRYKGDVNLMKFVGLNGFRLSISWPRVIPTGKLSEGVNPQGIAFYNKVINDLLAHGIEPFVTIYHWDLPEKLQKEYGGFLSKRITKDYVDFAELCFKEFGDRVKHWATINEPFNVAFLGYDVGFFPPGRCSSWINLNCTGGDSATEPYIVAHNIIISHGAIVKLYREKYKPTQKGQIGIVLNPLWFVPYSNHKSDIDAAQRSLDFNLGWFLDPLVFGEYPKSMQLIVGNRLPKFTPEQSKLVAGSLDFLGINYYTSNFARNAKFNVGPNISYSTDIGAQQTTLRNGKPIGAPTGDSVFFVYPDGLEKILVYTSNRYHKIPTYITECGYAEANIDTVAKGVKDHKRVEFYRGHLLALKSAIDKGANVKGFFAWSFLDTWEWNSGFTLRFGLTFVDFNNKLKRSPKLSALFFKKFLE